MEEVYIAGGLRSYVGVENGIYRHVPAEKLGAAVLTQLTEKFPYILDNVDMVICGNGVGGGGNITRLMMLEAGLREEIPAITVDMQCSSAMEAIAIGAAKIRCREAECVIAGGFESASTQPVRAYSVNHPEYEEGKVYRVAKFVPVQDVHVQDVHRENDREQHSELVMLEGAERTAAKEGISLEEMNRWVLESHKRAVNARDTHMLKDIVCSVYGSKRDEGIRDKMSERLLNKLPFALKQGQYIHMGNACLTNDGAAFVVLVSDRRRQEWEIEPQAKIKGAIALGGRPDMSPAMAVKAMKAMMKRAGLRPEQVDRFDTNEAFALIDVLFEREFPQMISRYNTYGGALAYGHPYGASGAIVLLHQMCALQHSGERYGISSVAAAGGLGSGMWIENLKV